MRAKLYKFFNYFSLVDFILVLMIIGLGAFTWSKYNQEMEITKNITVAKLKISSDDKRKTVEEYFRSAQHDLEYICNQRIDKKLFDKESKNKIYLVTKSKNSGFLPREYFHYNEDINDDSFYYTGFIKNKNNSDESSSYLIMKLKESNSTIGLVALQLKNSAILDMFNIRKEYRNYLIDKDYNFVDSHLTTKKELNVFKDNKNFKSAFSFFDDGVYGRLVVGYHEYFKVYNQDWAIVSEAESRVVFKSLHERRNNILVILISFLFFAIFVLVRSRYKSKEVAKKSEKRVLLWDKESFDDRFLEMQDMKESIVELFIEDISSQLLSLQSAIDSKDSKKIKHYTHTIKGAASNLSAIAIEELASIIEVKISQDSNYENIKKDFMNLEMFSKRTVIELQSYLKGSIVSQSTKILDTQSLDALKKIELDLKDGLFINCDSLELFKIEDIRVQELRKDILSLNTTEALLKIKNILNDEKEK